MATRSKRSEFIPVLGMPTKVLKYEDTDKERHDRLFLIVPGMPWSIKEQGSR